MCDLVLFSRNVSFGSIAFVRQLLHTAGIGSVMDAQRDVVFDTSQVIEQFLDKLVEVLNAMDPHLQLKIVYGGSVEDGTKVGQCDEVDVRLHIQNLEGNIWPKVDVDKELKHAVTIKVRHAYRQEWQPFTDDEGHILANKLFNHLHGKLAHALAKHEVYDDLPLMWKDLRNEHVYLEWVGGDLDGLPLKVDVLFAVTIAKWWPHEGRTEFCLLSKRNMKQRTTLILQPNGWRPCACYQEALIIKSVIPPVLKCAYMLAKIITQFVPYTEHEQHYKVNSYTLKNALMFTYVTYLQHTDDDQCDTFPELTPGGEGQQTTLPLLTPGGEYTSHLGGPMLPDWFIASAQEWAFLICQQGLQRFLIKDATYYFGFGRSCLKREQYEKYMSVFNVLLGQHTK